MKKIFLPLVVLTVITGMFVWGGITAFKSSNDSVFFEGTDPAVPMLELYTSGQATTPQIALFAAVNEGDLNGLFNLKIHIWKNPDDLMSVVLAGKGDLWVGHTDGFALANLRGAPVQMLLFTSFRKFYIISSTGFTKLDQLNGSTAAYAPAGSPAVALLENILQKKSLKMNLVPYQGRELELLIASGRVKTAILPEPLVSLMLSVNKEMKVLGNVEEMFCEANGIEGNIPMAGIAVNKSTAEKYPEKIALLQQIILRRGGLLRKNPETASRYFPSYFEKYIPAAIVEESLRRETLITSAAYELENELNLYLRAVHPGLFKEQNAPVMRDFLWRR